MATCSKTILGLCILNLMVTGSDAVACYRCDVGDNRCLDPFAPGSVATCNGPACIKGISWQGGIVHVYYSLVTPEIAMGDN